MVIILPLFFFLKLLWLPGNGNCRYYGIIKSVKKSADVFYENVFLSGFLVSIIDEYVYADGGDFFCQCRYFRQSWNRILQE